ncbi:MAG: hypothetical protein HRU28_18645 [Rhizobiales bacterium]|nr:hypothetical protein [Hyphomicrobiales bacterium]
MKKTINLVLTIFIISSLTACAARTSQFNKSVNRSIQKDLDTLTPAQIAKKCKKLNSKHKNNRKAVIELLYSEHKKSKFAVLTHKQISDSWLTVLSIRSKINDKFSFIYKAYFLVTTANIKHAKKLKCEWPKSIKA